MPMFPRLAAAAVVVIALASGTYLVFQGQDTSFGASPGPLVSPSVGPQASAADPIVAYRLARNRICMTARQAFSDNDDLVGVYNPSTPPDRRAIVNANAEDIADAIALAARDLAELEPPDDLAEAHVADVAHAQDEAAIAATASRLLADGELAAAQAMEHATEAVSNLRRPFETEYSLFNCP